MMQIKDLIADGTLRPGDKLPSERALATQFGIGRGYVREALKKLEFYGILKTLPQNGTIVANLGVRLLDGLIANVVQLEKNDLNALIETRLIMETGAARMAAERASTEDGNALETLFVTYREKTVKALPAIDEDMLFHLKIAEISGNRVLQSLISLLVPEVHQLSEKQKTCPPERLMAATDEHEKILLAIQQKNPDNAFTAMQEHLRNGMAFS